MIFTNDRRLDLKDSLAVWEMTVASFKLFHCRPLSPMKQALSLGLLWSNKKSLVFDYAMLGPFWSQDLPLGVFSHCTPAPAPPQPRGPFLFYLFFL